MSKKLIIIIVAVVLVLGGGAAAFFLLKKPADPTIDPNTVQGKTEKIPPPEDVKGERAHAPEGVDGEIDIVPELMFKFDPTVVNIYDKNASHYLKLSIEVMGTNKEVVEELTAKKSQLQDRLLFLMSDTSMRELMSSGGKTLLKEDIQASFNKVLKKGKIARIFFTEFTIQ